MNLTGITEFEEVLTKHFVDSLSIVKALDMAEINPASMWVQGPGLPRDPP